MSRCRCARYERPGPRCLIHSTGTPDDGMIICASWNRGALRKAALTTTSICRLKRQRLRFLKADAALCARSAITDTRPAAFRPLQLEPSSHHGAPIVPRMGTLALTEQAPPAAVRDAVAGDEEEVLFEESPICEQPVRNMAMALCQTCVYCGEH